MKRNHLFVLLLLAVLAGCKKESEEEEYFLSFMANGAEKRYTAYVTAGEEVTAGYTTLIILGSVSATATNDYLGIYINNDPGLRGIGTGEYTDASTNFTVLTTHARNGLDYEAGQTVVMDATYYGVTIPNRFKVTITQRSGDKIRGTFSGDYYEDGDVRFGEKITITNGEFHAKLQ
jgi:hypothetical protein